MESDIEGLLLAENSYPETWHVMDNVVASVGKAIISDDCVQIRMILIHMVVMSVQFSSVAQSCLTLCDPMNRSTPGLPVHHQLLEFTQTHVHPVGDAISSSVVPFSSCPQSLPASGSFPKSQLFAWGGQSIRVSALASVLPMNIPGLISFRMNWLDLLAVQGTLKSLLQHHTSKASILSCSAFFTVQLTSIHDHWKNHSLD